MSTGEEPVRKEVSLSLFQLMQLVHQQNVLIKLSLGFKGPVSLILETNTKTSPLGTCWCSGWFGSLSFLS